MASKHRWDEALSLKILYCGGFEMKKSIKVDF